MVSIYIGNLTWWTSDYDLEQQIRKNGIADLVEVNLLVSIKPKIML